MEQNNKKKTEIINGENTMSLIKLYIYYHSNVKNN